MRELHVVGAAITRASDGAVLVTRRSEKMSNPLSWEFPGGKVEPGESPEAALAREILEELGVRIEVHGFIAQGRAPAGSRLIVLDVYRAHLIDPDPQVTLAEHDQWRWCPVPALAALDWAPADVPIVEAMVGEGASR